MTRALISLLLATAFLTGTTAALGEEPDFAMSPLCGGVKERQGDLQGAITDYTKAIKLRPDYWFSYACRGKVRRAKVQRAKAGGKNAEHDIDGAIADFTDAIRVYPTGDSTLASTYFDRCETKIFRYQSFGKGDLAEAIADCTKAIELEQDSAKAVGIVDFAYEDYAARSLAKRLSGDSNGAQADAAEAKRHRRKNQLSDCHRSFSYNGPFVIEHYDHGCGPTLTNR